MSRATDIESHPRHGRRYGVEELQQLAAEGNCWAMGKVDEWELHHADVYAGGFTDSCPNGDCEQYGEPANVCYGEDGQILDIDHGGWGHSYARAQAKAS